jgi:hypothetical protein
VQEEARAARSAELSGQRRRAERHTADQSAAARRQRAAFDDGCAGFGEAAAAAAARVRGYEKLLGQALSKKGVDICWREAQALKVGLLGPGGR